MKMRSSVLLVSFILITSASGLFITNDNFIHSSEGATITVPGDYEKISYAVENASSGDTILVGPGEYNEEVIVDKPLTIQSTGGPGSTIVSNVGYTVFRLNSHSVTISGFTIRDAENGIYIEEYDDCTITDNIITRNWKGVQIWGNYEDVPMNHTIHGNNISDNTYCGIYIGPYGMYNSITNNILNDNEKYGIDIYHECAYNRIENNTIKRNGDGGMYLIGSGYSTVKNNEIVNNEWYGIYVLYSFNNKLRGNEMWDNPYNLRFQGEMPSSPDYTHDIDTSNLIEGKPIIYWVGESDKEVPSEAGFVGLVDCNNIVVSDVNVTYTGSGILLVRTNSSSIDGVDLIDNYYGIELLYSNSNTIQNVYGTLSGEAAIRLEDSDENIIHSNILYNNAYQFGDGIELYMCENNTITENTVEENGASGITLSWSDHCTLKNNTVRYNHKGYGIYLNADSDHNLVRDNRVIGNPLSNLGLSGSQYNMIIKNEFESSQDGSGVKLSSSYNNWVIKNEINENDGQGVYLDTSNFNSVSENTITENSDGRGVYLRDSESNTVNLNLISDNGNGIWLESGSNSNTLTNNSILNSQWYGIHLNYYCNYNDIIDNLVYNSREYYGISVLNSEGNYIYWNDFINNVKDAFDDGSNIWSRLYPSGGNYWSNYSGVDERSGVYQDQPGSDGFGDNSYPIPGGDNMDLYPFMEPRKGIVNTKPSASFTVEPPNGNLTTDFIFDASGCSDMEDDTSALLVRWDWEDDGTYDTDWLTTTLSVKKNFDEYGTYDVRLQVKDTGELTDSTVQHVYVYDKPSTPTNFQCRPADGAVLLSWGEPENDGGSEVDYYTIYKGTQNVALRAFKNVDERTFSYKDTEVYNGITYYYIISAVTARGEGDKTEMKSATPQEGMSEYLPPIADFEIYEVSSIENYGAKVNLYDISTPGDGELVNYSWRITNGVDITGYGKSILVDLPFGTHTVNYTVLDSNGESDSIEKDIEIKEPEPPTADFTWKPYYPEEYEMIWIVGKSIPGDNPIINWTYEFNGGEFYRYGGGWFSGLEGVYTVELTVSDGYLTDSITKEIVVAQSITHDITPGQASLVEEYEGNISIGIEVERNTELSLFEFPRDPTNSTLPKGKEQVGKCYGIKVNDSSSVKWPIIFKMYYTDDQLDESAVSEDSLKIFYWDEEQQEWYPASLEYTLNTTDQDGYSGYVEVELQHLTIFALTGNNPPPVADAGEDIEVEKGDTVTFDGSGCTDDMGIVNYTWSFEYEGDLKKMYGQSCEFEFDETGDFTVVLNITDTSGNSAEDSLLVKVVEEEEELFGMFNRVLFSLLIVAVVIIVAFMLYRRGTRSGGHRERPHH